jgi:hypothetical protein
MIDAATRFESFLKVFFSHILVIPYRGSSAAPGFSEQTEGKIWFRGYEKLGRSRRRQFMERR